MLFEQFNSEPKGNKKADDRYRLMKYDGEDLDFVEEYRGQMAPIDTKDRTHVIMTKSVAGNYVCDGVNNVINFEVYFKEKVEAAKVY